MAFSDYQYEIYFGGLGGATPALPLRYDDLQDRARVVLSPEAFDYVFGGAGSEDTMRANLDAFRRWRIVPRMLEGIGDRDLSVELFGARLDAPFLLGPVGVQGIVHPEAEVAVARAASSQRVPMVLSTVSSRPMEEVAQASGDNLRWFQLYWPNDKDLTASFLARAEAAGYSAIVVTLDTFFLAWRPRDLQKAFLPFLRGEGLSNYFTDPVFCSELEKSPEDDPQAAVLRWASVFSYGAATWNDLAFIREHTKLPVLLKGILHPDDARRALDNGMDGIVVSNHGGRQVDGAIATLDALPRVVEAVGDDCPVLLDSGLRSAADVIKAIALGARAALIGRPYIWALAVGGEDGVRELIRGFLAELDLTLALSGRHSLAEVDASVLEAEENLKSL